MKEILNDKRYGALRTLGERKQAFNEVYSFLVLRNDVQMHFNVTICKPLQSLIIFLLVDFNVD